MATRPRTPTFRTQQSVRRAYETLQPRSEMKETPEAFLLHVYLPGFTKERVKITFVGSSRMVRITGERPIHGNRWNRFDQTYPVPENCEAETLQGKFDLGTLVITMPKKFIPQEAPKPELNTAEQRTASEVNHEKAQETIPPLYIPGKVEEASIGDKKSVSLPSPVQGPSDMKEQKATHQEDTFSERQRYTGSQHSEDERRLKALIPPETIRDRSPQKGQEKTVKEPTVISKPPKGKERVEPPKSTLATVARVTSKEKHEEEIRLKARLAEVKKQLVGTRDEDVDEKERMNKWEVKEERKPSDLRKPANDWENHILKEKEIGTSKVSPKEAEPSVPKVPKKDKESNNGTSPSNIENKSKEDIIDIVGNGIRELAFSASIVASRIAEGKLKDEEKQLVVNIGAAVLVIAALGAYVSHRFASS